MNFKIVDRSHQYRELTEIQPPQLRDLYLHWYRARSGDEIPNQRDISPDLLEECAGNIALIHLDTDPKQARYILVGTNLKRLLGKDPTNMAIENVYSPAIAKEVYEAIGKTVRSREATFFQRTFVVLGQSFGYFRLILPMRLEGDEVTRLLFGIYPTDERLTEAKTWQNVVRKFYQRRKEFEDQNPRKIGTIWESSLDR